MEKFNGILCITAEEFTNGVVSKSNYDQLVNRNKIEVVRRGCRGTVALIRWDSVREPYRSKFIEIHGDPEQQMRTNWTSLIVEDSEARMFYRSFRRPDGSSLSDQTIDLLTNTASLIQYLQEVLGDRRALRNGLGKSMTGAWEVECQNCIEAKRVYNHNLPENVDRFKQAIEKFKQRGYASLISGHIGNKRTEKLCEEAKRWLIARMASKLNVVPSIPLLWQEYNEVCKVHGWEQLLSHKTIALFLNRPEIKIQWYSYRYGAAAGNNLYQHKHKTLMPTSRDMIWYGDGTKLNLYYQENGKLRTCQAYHVSDAFSDIFLGVHISATEDYIAQFNAIKSAIQFSGHRPSEFRVDNQGGHKKLENMDFFKKVAHLAINTKPYNGSSKTIENAFGRFQHMVLKREPFYTGSNITAHTLESHLSREFVAANIKNLPTLKELKQRYMELVAKWNAMPHHKTGIPRIQMYQESVNPHTRELNAMDYVDMFWIERDRPVTATASAISFSEKNVAYDYFVYDDAGNPSADFIRNHVGRKLFIKWDPADTSRIALFAQDHSGKCFIGFAQEKTTIHRAILEQEDWESTYIKGVDKTNEDVVITTREGIDTLLAKYNMLPEQHGYNSPGIPGITTRKNPYSKRSTVASIEKTVSNMDVMELASNAADERYHATDLSAYDD